MLSLTSTSCLPGLRSQRTASDAPST